MSWGYSSRAKVKGDDSLRRIKPQSGTFLSVLHLRKSENIAETDRVVELAVRGATAAIDLGGVSGSDGGIKLAASLWLARSSVGVDTGDKELGPFS